MSTSQRRVSYFTFKNMPTPQTIDLTPWNIQRPEKVRWLYDLSAPDILSTIKSKTLTKLLRNADELLARYDVTYQHRLLDKQLYAEWWQHYHQKMISKRYDIIATEDWFAQKMAEGKKVYGFFFYHQEKLCGTILYVQKETTFTATFKTSSEIPGLTKKHRSLGAIIDFIFLREALKQRPTSLSLGSMRNAFGVINSLGNLEYKLNMGYVPVPKEDTSFLTSVPVAEDGRGVFFGVKDGKLQLFCLKRFGDPDNFEFKRFDSDRIPVNVITY